MTTSTKTKPAPPEQAVAQDAHWAKTMARLDRLERPVAKLTICPDPDLRENLSQAKRDLDRANSHRELVNSQDEDDRDAGVVAAADKNVAHAEAAVQQAQAAFDEEAIVLRFQALSRTQLDALSKKHPPTEEDEQEGSDVNEQSFPPELISAASMDGMPLEYAQQCWETWSLGESQALYEAALSVQRQMRTDLGKG